MESIPRIKVCALVQQNTLPRQIEATDRQIDALVYELYGLTGEEIGIIGDSSNAQ